MRNNPHPAALLIQMLNQTAPLTPEAVRVVEAGCGPAEACRTGEPLPGAAGRAFVVLAGWIAEERLFPDGRRQILRLLVAGDVCGLRPGLAGLGAEISALTETVIADVSPLRRLVDEGLAPPSLIEAWRGLIEAEEVSALRHLVRLGRLSAFERTAQFLVELAERLSKAGMVRGPIMPMPLTQKHLADHLGLSVVHVNRVLQQLRRAGYVEHRQRQVVFKNLAALADVALYPLGPPPAGPPRETAAARA